MTNRLQALFFWLLTILYYIWFLKLIGTSFITLSIAHKSWWFANPYLMSSMSQIGVGGELFCIRKGVSIPISIQNLHLVTSIRMSSTLTATVQTLLTSHNNNTTQSKLIKPRELCKNFSEQQWMSYVSGGGGISWLYWQFGMSGAEIFKIDNSDNIVQKCSTNMISTS